MKSLLACIAVVALTGAAAPVPAPEGNPSAHGNYVRSNGTHVIFHILKQKNGRVSGTLFYETSTGFILTANYDDAVFAADGKTVYLHGIVTFASNASLIGYPTVQKVIDNGEGNWADPDAVSAIASGQFVPADWVTYLDGFGTLGIVGGNIQVLAH